MKKTILMLVIAVSVITGRCFGQAPQTFAAKKYAVQEVKKAFTVDISSSYLTSVLREDFDQDAMTITSTDVDSTFSEEGLKESFLPKIKKQTKIGKSHPPTVLAAMYNIITSNPDQLSPFSNLFFIEIADEEGSTIFTCILSKVGDKWMLRCVFFDQMYSIGPGAKIFFISS